MRTCKQSFLLFHVLLWLLFVVSSTALALEDRPLMLDSFKNPPMDCRPQTRWWWMGNALTKEEITWQIQEMYSQGIGGVEQITMPPVYEKGNIPYLSDAFFDLIKHAVSEAQKRQMTVSLNFGGDGWIWGGDWIPKEERNQTLLSSSMIVTGPQKMVADLPTDATINPRDIPRSFSSIKPADRLVAVVAGQLMGDKLDPDSLRVVTDQVQGRRLTWNIPSGTWRIMAFWATFPDDSNTVNHLDKKAMEHYVSYLGEKYKIALGDALGTTVESFFGDSFEVPIYRNGIYWSDSLPATFHSYKGYELWAYLPAIWWEIGDLSPKIRYDLNEVLHKMGMEAFFNTFTAWCRDHGVKSRVQPYGFVTDNLEGAGVVDIPEMEITAGEKDAAPWFDTRIWPREYVASGAHIYGKNIISTEAYTYLHWEPYRATLEELKIASDMFLRAGANRFNNHGFIASPERDIAPTRGFYAAIHISPDNIWWPYYHVLSDYLARSCYLLRQGTPCSDIAVYSPTANQWTMDVLNARKWTRNFEWGELGRLILGNGYNYDLINDDALQHRSVPDAQTLKIGNMQYKALILPNITAIPLDTLRHIEAYAAQGGVVIALERIPEASCGLNDWKQADQEVRALAARMFSKPAGRIEPAGKRTYGQGVTYCMERVLYRTDALEQHSSALDPFLNVLRSHIPPDLSIDFVREAMRDNKGLCFTHRAQHERDVYFVTNVDEHRVDMPVGFRVSGAVPWHWNPYTGEAQAISVYQEQNGITSIPVTLAPYESAFFVFEKSKTQPHVIRTTLSRIEKITSHAVTGYTDRIGEHTVTMDDGAIHHAQLAQLPAPLILSSPWQLVLESPTFARVEMTLDDLVSWTQYPQTQHFSGTGVYTSTFYLPKTFTHKNIQLFLDLGDVGNIAEVFLNGKKVDVVWMPGQRLDITGLVHFGRNHIEINVTNTLINRVSGLSEFPPVPEVLRARLGDGLNEKDSPANALRGFSPLPRSGLLGPVTIIPYKKVNIRF